MLREFILLFYSLMAAVLAKSFGWTYSQSIRLISQNDLWKACMSSKSQFIGRKMKKKIQNQKKRLNKQAWEKT